MSNTVDKVVFENVDPAISGIAPSAPVDTASAPAETAAPAAADLQAELEGLKVYKLAKPLVINGRELTELNLDIDSLTGKDLKAAEREYRIRFRGDAMNVPLADIRFREIIVGKLNGFIGEDLENLPAGAYNAIMFRVQGFFGSQV
jgi:hypothetical protein